MHDFCFHILSKKRRRQSIQLNVIKITKILLRCISKFERERKTPANLSIVLFCFIFLHISLWFRFGLLLAMFIRNSNKLYPLLAGIGSKWQQSDALTSFGTGYKSVSNWSYIYWPSMNILSTFVSLFFVSGASWKLWTRTRKNNDAKRKKEREIERERKRMVIIWAAALQCGDAFKCGFSYVQMP